MWQDLWVSGQSETVTMYHVTGHLPLVSPGNDKADTLAQVHWLEGNPASHVVEWLHHHLLHGGRKTIWAVANWWGLLFTFEEVSRA